MICNRAAVLSWRAFLALTVMAFSAFDAASAADTFHPAMVISDGQDGRVYRQWRQQLPDQPVRAVEVTLRKTSGGNDTYVNLRYGSGTSFEGGRRVQLPDTSQRTVRWEVGGERPAGRPLVLNAYKGEVHVDSVRVSYASDQPASPPPPPPPAQQPRVERTERDIPRESAREIDPGVVERCRYERVRRPRIEIAEVDSTGGLFSGKYRVEGSIFGACIEEAGYYELGRLKDAFEIPLDDRYRREPFSVKVRSGKRGEIRAFTSDGSEEIIDVDELIQDQGSLLR